MAEKSKVAEASSAEEPKIKETSSAVEPADGTTEEKGPAPEESLVVVESKMLWPTYGRPYEHTRVATPKGSPSFILSSKVVVVFTGFAEFIWYFATCPSLNVYSLKNMCFCRSTN
jgi:hypothetical protein